MAKRVGILYESDEWSDWKLHRELDRPRLFWSAS